MTMRPIAIRAALALLIRVAAGPVRAQETTVDPERVAAIANLLGQQVASQWFAPAGSKSADLIMHVEVALASDGRVTDYAFRDITGTADEATRDMLMRSVARTLDHFRTTPFLGLPREDYEIWQVFRMTFDPGALP